MVAVWVRFVIVGMFGRFLNAVSRQWRELYLTGAVCFGVTARNDDRNAAAGASTVAVSRLVINGCGSATPSSLVLSNCHTDLGPSLPVIQPLSRAAFGPPLRFRLHVYREEDVIMLMGFACASSQFCTVLGHRQVVSIRTALPALTPCCSVAYRAVLDNAIFQWCRGKHVESFLCLRIEPERQR
jgi:hypothetical protein